MILTSTTLGVLSAVGGFVFSYLLDLPTGACIALASSAIFALAVAYKAIWGRVD